MKKIKKVFYLEKSDLEKVYLLAKKNDRTPSGIMRLAIRRYE